MSFCQLVFLEETNSPFEIEKFEKGLFMARLFAKKEKTGTDKCWCMPQPCGALVWGVRCLQQITDLQSEGSDLAKREPGGIYSDLTLTSSLLLVFPAKATIYLPQTKVRKHRNLFLWCKRIAENLPRLKAGWEKAQGGSGELIEDARRKYTRSIDSGQ